MYLCRRYGLYDQCIWAANVTFTAPGNGYSERDTRLFFRREPHADRAGDCRARQSDCGRRSDDDRCRRLLHASWFGTTFRPDVARMAVEEFGADIINDVSEGSVEMFRMIARLRVPYILMSVQPNLRDMLLAFAREVQQLRDFGVKDIILDPGFGFGKTVAQNYSVMNQLERLQIMELPLLVGISRKSMIFKLLGLTPDESLNGTSVLNTIALMKGASILRVHDVKEAVECVRIVESLNGQIDK